jgi:hypothetical protein
MGASPVWKVYDPLNGYVASCKDTEGASLLMDLYGEGSTIRYSHRLVVWTEGKDGRASNSYDKTREIINQRLLQQ